jgi:hypothetical protein
MHIPTKLGRESKTWLTRARNGGDQSASHKSNVMRDIMWQAAENNWFEYPMGSRILYFCYLLDTGLKLGRV